MDLFAQYRAVLVLLNVDAPYAAATSTQRNGTIVSERYVSSLLLRVVLAWRVVWYFSTFLSAPPAPTERPRLLLERIGKLMSSLLNAGQEGQIDRIPAIFIIDKRREGRGRVVLLLFDSFYALALELISTRSKRQLLPIICADGRCYSLPMSLIDTDAGLCWFAPRSTVNLLAVL